MAHVKPIITLVAGAVLALVLLAWSAQAAGAGWLVLAADEEAGPGSGAAPPGEDPAEDTADAAADEPVGAPAGSDTAARERFGTALAGSARVISETEEREATMAVAIHEGRAAAYVCDGAELEMWLDGEAADGELTLTGPDGAELTGSYDDTAAVGNLLTYEGDAPDTDGAEEDGDDTAGADDYGDPGGPDAVNATDAPFELSWLTEPASGLYRAEAALDQARLVIGWIVLDTGEQIGVATLDGEPAPAPPLDTDTLTAEFDGTEIHAGRIGGDA